MVLLRYLSFICSEQQITLHYSFRDSTPLLGGVECHNYPCLSLENLQSFPASSITEGAAVKTHLRPEEFQTYLLHQSSQ